MQQMATGPTPYPEHSVGTHTVRLYCNEVGGETSKKGTRTCTVPQIVPHSYCPLLHYSCSVTKDTVLESDYGDSEAASYSCCSVNSLTHCSPQLMVCD